jgi:hypothetical protein
MSWFRRAYNLSTALPGDFYTLIDLPTYYEWLYKNFIPAGARFTKQMPRSDALTEGVVVVSASIPRDNLARYDDIFKVSKDTQCRTVIVAGEVKTPSELASKFGELISKFDRDLESFKQSCSVRRYLFGGQDENHLYRIRRCEDTGVVLDNLGTDKELDTTLTELQSRFSQESATKQGRAIEAADARRFDSALLRLKSGDLPLNTADIDFIVAKGAIVPTNSRKLSWEECFIEMVPEANELNDKLRRFSALEWVQNLTYLW